MKKLLFLLLTLLVACNQVQDEESGILLARAYDSYLYMEDIKGIVPEYSNSRDSLTIVQNYINKWIQQQLIIEKAKSNLTKEELNFKKQLDEYENSLITYAYESKLIRQELDTVISNSEIESYYEGFKNNFELTENIIRFNYVKLNIDSPQVNQFRSLIGSADAEQLLELEELCKKFASDYWLEDEWLYFNDVIEQFPMEVTNQENFLKRNRNLEVREDPFFHFFSIKDYKLNDNIAPLEFEVNNIKQIIINNRKLELVKAMRSGLMDAAVKNNEVEIF